MPTPPIVNDKYCDQLFGHYATNRGDKTHYWFGVLLCDHLSLRLKRPSTVPIRAIICCLMLLGKPANNIGNGKTMTVAPTVIINMPQDVACQN